MTGGLRTPGWAVALGWIVTVGFLAIYDFVVHASFRGMLPAFGFQFGPFLQALFGTIVMGLFVIWLVTLAELPEMWFAHRRPSRLHREGRCPACGQPRGTGSPITCAECGHGFDDVPPPYSLGLSAVRRFGVALGLGLLFGVTAAEVSIALDEASMRAKAEPFARTTTGGAPAELTFHRAWPATFARVHWSAADGFHPLPLAEEWNWPD